MQKRRLFLSMSLALAATGFLAGAAQAHDWSWGGGERIKGSGEIVSETREPGAFDGVAMGGSFKVLIRQSSSNKLQIKTDKNILPYIETRISESGKGRTLEIGTKRGYNISPSSKTELIVEMPQMRQVSISGSGDIKIEPMKTGPVEISVSGSGDLKFDNLQSERLGISVAGSGDVGGSGKTGELKISVSGSGDVKLRDLAAEDAKVSIAGSGDAVVNVSRKLSVSVAGSGDVSYVGSPEISTSIAGNGKVRKVN